MVRGSPNLALMGLCMVDSWPVSSNRHGSASWSMANISLGGRGVVECCIWCVIFAQTHFLLCNHVENVAMLFLDVCYKEFSNFANVVQ
jgi:hypothetical protein